eukprot:TRINITY_DN1796_c0_g1_i2.p1 TRINITY_DN1796_c0_g1~~TRINITY_DN1796_c0_g1_i2.p1  ORF type:complete len:623 (+),score=191.64 TRINITY_DN1796_c0_g1_i2:31-1899(+)
MNSTSCSGFSHHNILMSDNGDVYSFGYNSRGQCGTTDKTNEVMKPTKIFNNPTIKSIVLGEYHSFYLEKSGDLYGCGINDYGQLGIQNNKSPNLLNFTLVSHGVTQLCASERITIIQKSDGKIYWSGFWSGLNKRTNGFELIKIDNVISFSCGRNHCLFLKEGGEVWVMGSNQSGECGLDEKTKFVEEPRHLMTDKNVFSICCGYLYSFILTKNNKGNTILNCFGYNGHGQLGLNNKNSNQYGIAIIDTFPNISSIHCGAFHSLILTKEGDVYSSGCNEYGELCLGNNTKCNSFTKTNLKNIFFITTGYQHSIFVNKKKEIFVSGRGEYGRLGLGNKSDKYTASRLEFENLRMVHNNSASFYEEKSEFDVNFIFEMRVEKGETFKEEFKKIFKVNTPVKSMVEEIMVEKKFFELEEFQTKFMFLFSVRINNQDLDKKLFDVVYENWQQKSNTVSVIYCIPFSFSKKEKEITDLKEQVKNLKTDVKITSELKTKLSIEEKENSERSNKLELLKKKIKENSSKLSSFTSSPPLNIEEKEEYVFLEPLNEMLKCSACKNLLNDPKQCGECLKNCCTTCCTFKDDNYFCSFGCKDEEMFDNSAFKKRISNIMVRCCEDSKEMKLWY